MTLISDYVDRNARLFPHADAIADGERRLTHGELAARAKGIARALASLGVKRGDNVGVLAHNTVFSVETFLGVVAAGGAYVAYNWRWAREELIHGINLTEARVVLVAEGYEDVVKEISDSGQLLHSPVFVMEGAQLDSLTEADVVPDGPQDPEDPAVVLFTGGTTGFSKGVTLSHRACMANAIQEIMDCRVGSRPHDRCVISTPMFHSAALLCWLLPHYVTGAFSYVMHRFDETELARIVEAEQITNMFLVPNMIRRMLTAGAFDTPGFRTHFKALHSGAGLLRLPDKQALLDLMPGLDLYFRYGLTEAGPMVSRLLPQDIMREDIDGSIGMEYSLTQVELRADDGVMAVGLDEIGEIWVRGPGLMTGYYGQPEATDDVLVDGWLRTGDMATRDGMGYLYFRDRSKDMIKTGGENVYSSEIEQVLHTHGSVMEAVVLGVPSLEWDEEVRAVISIRDGHDVSEDELRTFLRQKLAGYKIPKVMVLVGPGEIPVNAANKIVKADVRKRMGW